MHAWHSWMSWVTSSGCRLGTWIIGCWIHLKIHVCNCIWKFSVAFIRDHSVMCWASPMISSTGSYSWQHRNRLVLVWLPLSSTHSILYYGHMTFDLHPLLECNWGIQQGLGIVTCNTEDLVAIGLICVSWTFSDSTLFQSDLLPHLQSLYSIHACALCFWVPLGGTWEHKTLAWVGYKLLRWGDILPCGVYYSKFLDFFPVWGELSVNHGRLCNGEDVCGNRPLLRQSTTGLGQEWTPPR